MANEKGMLFGKEAIPGKLLDDTQKKWGNDVEAFPARADGKYNGVILAGESSFLAQKVSDKAVVIHERSSINFSGNPMLEKREQENRLNDTQLSIQYEGKEAKAYFYDPQRAQINLNIIQVDKAAKEILVPKAYEMFSKQLGEIKNHLVEKYKERKEKDYEARTKHEPAAKPVQKAAAKTKSKGGAER